MINDIKRIVARSRTELLHDAIGLTAVSVIFAFALHLPSLI